jgi:hypothetical protein
MRYLVQDAADPSLCGEEHEPTDLYCVPLRQSLVRYQLLLTVGLIATGVVALLLTGFVGYYYCPLIQINGQLYCTSFQADRWYHVLFLSEPWPLYLWLSAIMVLLQVSILRSAALRSRLIATLVMTLISIGVVAYVYFNGQGKVARYLFSLLYHPLTYAIINFGLLLLLVINSFRRWLGYRAGTETPPWLRQLMVADPGRSQIYLRKQAGELFAGSLIAGMLLSAVLAVVFTQPFLGTVFGAAGGSTIACGHTVVHPNATLQTLQQVTTSLHLNSKDFFDQLIAGTWLKDHQVYPCPVPFLLSSSIQLAGISLFDQILAAIFFVLAMLVLGNTAFAAGLDPLMEASTRERADAVSATDATGESPAEESVKRVSDTVLDTLREAVERYVLPSARQAVLSVRIIVWPALILIGSFSFALCARYVQYYLHHYDPSTNCSAGLPGSCQPPNSLTYLVPDLVPAVAFGAVALICTVTSIALFLPSGRVATNSFRFLGRVGFVVLLTFWMFSLALFGLNWLLVDVQLVPRALTLSILSPQAAIAACGTPSTTPSWQIMLAPDQACSQPFGLSWLTAISFAALILALVFLVLRARVGYFSARAARARALASPGSGGARRPGG